MGGPGLNVRSEKVSWNDGAVSVSRKEFFNFLYYRKVLVASVHKTVT